MTAVNAPTSSRPDPRGTRELSATRKAFGTSCVSRPSASRPQAQSPSHIQTKLIAITAALLAGQVIATQRILATENRRRIVSGRSADEVRPEAVADADLAFALLRHGPTTATEGLRNG
jgi:hypothetical protein